MIELKSPYILDGIIQTLEELLKDNHVDIKIPLSELGTFCDIITFINRYNNSAGYEVNLEVLRTNGASEKTHMVDTRGSFFKFDITAVEGISPEEPETAYPYCNIYSDSDKVSFAGKGMPQRIREKIFKQDVPLHWRFEAFLPKKKVTCTLQAAYMGPSPFPTSMFFYSPKKLGNFMRPQSHKPGSEYPISTQQEINVSEQVYDFIRDPIFWDAWSNFYAKTILLLNEEPGCSTIKDIAKTWNLDENRIKKHMLKSIPSALAELAGMPFEELAQKFDCPKKCWGFYRKKWTSTKIYNILTNPEKLAKSYNAIAVNGDASLLQRAGFTKEEADDIIAETGDFLNEFGLFPPRKELGPDDLKQIHLNPNYRTEQHA